MILALFNLFSDGSAQMNSRQISYSDFIQRVEKDEVTAVTIDGENIAVLLEDHVAPESSLDSVELIVEMSADVFGEQTAAPAAWGAMWRLEQLARGNAAFVGSLMPASR